MTKIPTKIKINKKTGIREISEEEFKEHLLNSKSNGSGSKEDPFIVKEMLPLPEEFDIKGSTLHVNFYDLKFERIALINCQNITFLNCSFSILVPHNSSHIKCDSCSISDLGLYWAHDNVFNNCTIDEIINRLTNDNTFNDCTLNDEIKDGLLNPPLYMGNITGFFSKIVQMIILVMSISFISTLSMFISGNFDLIFVIFQGLVIIGLTIAYVFIKRGEKNQRVKSPNQIFEQGESVNFQPQHE